LLRADAHTCSLCGYVFLQATLKHSSRSLNGSRHSTMASFPSNPPASPHRAGHYSGLHPEDQPYQSSFMPILRPPAITRRLVEQESDEVLEPAVISHEPPQLVYDVEHEQIPKRYLASPIPSHSPMPQRSPGALSQMAAPVPLLEIEPPPFVPESTQQEQCTVPLPAPADLADKRQPRKRIVRILFIAAILSFLLGSSILAYLVLFTGTGVPVHPAAKVVHTGSQQGQSTVPQLHLSASYIDFGAVNVQNPITLTNAGDQQINWQAGVDSNSSWLGITPNFGVISKKKTATVTVSRSNLAPGAYTGYINFFQQGTNNASTLKVTMRVTSPSATVTVSPPPTILTVSPSPIPAMALSTNALAFSAIQGTNPAQQTFTLANPGNAALNWAITVNANATTLLAISPKNGTVATGSSVPITVTPNVAKLTAGVFTATIIVQGAQVKSQQVAVKITISNQAVISVSPTNIACTLSSTTTTSTQSLNITNSGSATLDWTLLSQPLPSWISIDTPSGTLSAGYIAFVNVACNNTGLQAGTYTYTLVVSDTDAHTPVTSQNVLVTVTVS
ncbi:MAG TPA: hypothetical protein VEH81_11380, partial [Ktedonobacteraceae bacterium]|nr:hypothetical protein [Ktedonobacteraceae bacterium]